MGLLLGGVAFLVFPMGLIEMDSRFRGNDGEGGGVTGKEAGVPSPGMRAGVFVAPLPASPLAGGRRARGFPLARGGV